MQGLQSFNEVRGARARSVLVSQRRHMQRTAFGVTSQSDALSVCAFRMSDAPSSENDIEFSLELYIAILRLTNDRAPPRGAVAWPLAGSPIRI